MKKIITILLLIISLSSIAQKSSIEKVIDLTIQNKSLEIDTTKMRLEIESLKRNIKNLQSQTNWKIDSLKRINRKLSTQIDSLSAFKRKIDTLSKGDVLLYQRNAYPDYIFYINMLDYNCTIQENETIKLSPIRDEKKKKIYLYDLPQPDNLSLHLYPHKLDGDKIKK